MAYKKCEETRTAQWQAIASAGILIGNYSNQQV